MSEDEVKQQLKAFIVKTSGYSAPEALANDRPLIEDGILSSLHVMELLLYIEHLRGTPLKVENLQPGVFHDINSIFSNFFAASP